MLHFTQKTMGSAAHKPQQQSDADPMKTVNPENPEDHTGFLGKSVFSWMTRIFDIGNTHPLQENDLYALCPRDRTDTITNAVEENYSKAKAWSKQNQPGQPAGVYRALKDTFGRPFYYAGVVKFINDILGFTTPVILNFLLQFLEKDWESWLGYVLAVVLWLSLVLRSFVENHYFYNVTRISMQVRTAITGLVYNKSLRLSPSAKTGTTSGQIVNLMQLDATKISVLMMQLHFMWSGIFQILGYLAQLFYYIGPSALAGVALMPLIVVFQGKLMVKLGALRKKQMQGTDERVKQTNEIIQGVRAIKMYSWESNFAERINHWRETAELSIIARAAIIGALNFTVIVVAPTIILVITFLFYTAVQGESMKGSIVFTVVTVFERLRFPILMYPQVIAQFVDAKVAMKRLTDFMGLPEVEGRPTENLEFADDEEERKESGEDGEAEKQQKEQAVVHLDKCSFAWSSDTPALMDVSLRVGTGKLVAIVGSVGVGKSALVSAILSELNRISGEMCVKGKIAYVAQQAWILNAAVRDNILFGHPLEEERYQKVLEVCSLSKDMEVLPDGDLTEIGERGINLSGGQKQRVSIARATYSDADIYILDDPLSALDAEVSRKVFDECITGALANKTRIMVTNQLHFVSRADLVVVVDTKKVPRSIVPAMRALTQLGAQLSNKKDASTPPPAASTRSVSLNASSSALITNNAAKSEDPSTASSNQNEDIVSVGYIKEMGSYNDLVGKGLDFAQLVKKHGGDSHSSDDSSDNNSAAPKKDEKTEQKGPTVLVKSGTKAQLNKAVTVKGKHGLVTEEERNTGAVDAKVYVSYFAAAASPGLVAFMIFCNILLQANGFISSFWISYWSKEDSKGTSRPVGFFIGIYAGLAVVYGIVSFFRMWSLTDLTLLASRQMHKRLMASILNAPTSFFDTTPSGRIVARFSKDMGEIDVNLTQTMNMTLNSVLSVVTSLVVIIAVTPLFASLVLPLLYIYFKIMNFYRNSAREIKRLDSTTRSPVYAHFGATLGGLSTIRAYNVQQRFVGINEQFNDRNNRANYALRLAERWLTIRLEMVGNLVILGAAIFAVISRSSIDSGLAGLSLTYAISVTIMLSWAVRCIAELENQMNAVERVLHYTNNIPQERARTIEATRPREDWPKNGEIEFDKLKLRYRPELDLVLKGVSLNIRPREKVGVVGRTGSGKSTMLLSLMRLIEADEGQIRIDGIDTSTLGLHDLRSRISIIPQDPVLFSGTLRFNLDPTEKCSDADIWDALEKVKLKEEFSSKTEKLEYRISEYGENLSAGQRQLICLGRAILRKSRVLLLDEATSSIDLETDALVQELIRKEFEDRTILTIAHRINTIIDSDRVLVLSDGNVAEFDHPGKLLADSGSFFSRLVDQTGDSFAAQLKKVATTRWQSSSEPATANNSSEPM